MPDQLVNAPQSRWSGIALVKWGVQAVCVLALLALGFLAGMRKICRRGVRG